MGAGNYTALDIRATRQAATGSEQAAQLFICLDNV